MINRISSASCTAILTAAGFLTVSCEKKPGESPTLPKETEFGPGKPALSTRPNAPKQAAAAREKFEKEAGVQTRILRTWANETIAKAKEEITGAEVRMDTMTSEEKAIAREKITHQQNEVIRAEQKLRRQEYFLAEERKEWAAKDWEGYPNRTPEEEKTRQALINSAPYLSSTGRAAFQDFSTRTAAKRLALQSDLNRLREEVSRLKTQTVRNAETIAKMKANAQEAEWLQKAFVAYKHEMDEIAAEWDLRDWEGYIIPATPDAPPPKAH